MRVRRRRVTLRTEIRRKESRGSCLFARGETYAALQVQADCGTMLGIESRGYLTIEVRRRLPDHRDQKLGADSSSAAPNRRRASWAKILCRVGEGSA